MRSRLARLLIAGCLCLWLGGVASVVGADIKLKDGTTYNHVKILDRDATTIQVQVAAGTIQLTIADIESIDGVLLNPRPQPSAAAVTNAPVWVPPPPYVHSWHMELFLLLFALLALAWIGTMLWVQRDAPGTPAQVKRINTDVLLLPGLGFILYLRERSRSTRTKTDASTLTSRVAGLKPNEAPKKRGLFGQRTKITVPFRAKKQKVGMEFLDANRNLIEIRKDQPEMTGIEAAREVLDDAIGERASDIHLEPRENGCRVRFRIDGALQERMVFEKTDGLRVTAALKALAQIDVAEKRKAQDGRFRVRTQGGEIDFRVATTSSIYGEKMVLRILDRQSGLIGLTQLGMPEAMLKEFDRAVHSRNGMILATGPTGSGKTSTLYAALSRVDTKRLNLMTIEDPVEYELEGATQIVVNAKAGVTYESGLRSILRLDPDVIFVGEMRDLEAAKIALRAVLTGHLVFSTLHAKDAPSAPIRLVEMGVERYEIAAALLMVLSQRLVRVLCKQCREPYQSSATDLAEVGVTLPAGQTIYRARGCEACDQTGYQGRTGIFELLMIDEECRRVINEGGTQQQLAAIGARKGFRSYYEDGAAKVLQGITTVEEVLQAS